MKKCFSLFFLLVEIFFFLIYYGRFTTEFASSLFSQDLNNPAVAWIDPLAPTAAADQTSANLEEPEQPQYGRVTQFLKKVAAQKQEFTKRITEDMPYYYSAVYASRLWDRLSGKNVTTSVAGMFDGRDSYAELVLELSNGSYALAYPKTEEIDGVVESNLEQTLTFAKEMQDMGINFLYMEIPSRTGLAHNDPEYQKYAGIFDDATQAYGPCIRSRIADAGIPIVDILELYPDIAENVGEYYFRTDHHWLPQTGLMACTALGKALNETCGYAIDTNLFDLENYDDSASVKWLGFMGRKATEAYCETEDITILQPLYDTDFTVRISNKNNVITGSMTETLFDRECLTIQNPYTFSAYTVYGHGDRPLISIENNQNHDGKRLLVIKKSFADVMVPFLAAGVDHMDVIDLRSYSGNLHEYIAQTKPDTIVMIYGSAGFVLDDGAFDFT